MKVSPGILSRRLPLVVFAIALPFLALFRSQALFYPPYWDAIMGPFHEAIWLLENGFDYGGLAREALGYSHGGPRTYFFSVYPGLLAALMGLIPDSRSSLLASHLLVIALAAGGVALFADLVGERFGARAAWLAAPVLLLHPLFLSQAYAIHMEIALLFLGLLGVRAYVRGRIGRAALWCLACGAIKANGLVIALAVAGHFAAAQLRDRRDLGRLLLLASPALLYGVEALVSPWLFLRHEPDLFLRLPRAEDALLRFLGTDPFLFGGLVAVAGGCAGLLAVALWKAPGQLRTRLAGEPLAVVSALVCAQVYGASLLVAIFLSRYLLVALPFLLVALVWGVHRVAPRLLDAASPALLLVWGLGLFAEPPGIEAFQNNGHQLERTLAYEDDLELNLALARRLEAEHGDAVLVASWPFVHMLASPRFHYVKRPLEVVSTDVPSLRWMGVPHLKQLDLSDRELTDRMLWVWSPNDHARESRPDTRRDTLVERLERGARRIYLYRRSPAFYRAASQPGFDGWERWARRIGPEWLERWPIGSPREDPSR